MPKVESKVEVKKVILKVGKKEISLSLEEARALRGVLNGLFGGDVEIEHHYYPNPYPIYVEPYRPYENPWREIRYPLTVGENVYPLTWRSGVDEATGKVTLTSSCDGVSATSETPRTIINNLVTPDTIKSKQNDISP